jgi:putative flippase GtrA
MIRRLPSLVPALFGALIIMSFVAVVGRPNVFTDTRDYMIHGARFYQALRRTFLHEKEPVPVTAEQKKAAELLAWHKHFDHSNVGARSPYYGIFLYTLAHRGTLWLLTAVQSLACAWMIFLLWRAIAAEAPGWTYYALMAALSLGTSLPWFASFAMPDIFAGVLVIGAALLLFYRDQLTRWEKPAVCVIVGVVLAFHGSHPLLMAAMVVVGVLLARLMKAPKRAIRGYVQIAGVGIIAAMVALFVYAEAIYLHTGDHLRRPPFMMALVISDGPGRTYLRESCAKGAPWVICPYRNLPLKNSDQILWSSQPATGVFNRMNYEDRVAMEKQETEFVVATFFHHPIAQMEASLSDWGQQLTEIYVDDPLRPPRVFILHKYWGKTNLVDLMRGVGPCGSYGELCEPKVRFAELEMVDTPIVLFAILGLVVALCQKSTLLGAIRRGSLDWNDPMHRAAAASLFIAAAVILNAGICGMIAGPFARYQARLIWLIPAEALLLATALVPAAAWARLKTRSGLDSLDGLWDRLWPVTARVAALKAAVQRQAGPEFVRFLVVGAFGFCMDAGLLQVFLHLGLGYYTGRIPSFLIACSATWLVNRLWTFKAARHAGKMRQAALYLGVQCVGWVTNLAIYALCLLVFPQLKAVILLPLAAGAGGGMVVNFLGSKHLAFRARLPAAGKSGAIADTPAA